jgi:hypothetical protein
MTIRTALTALALVLAFGAAPARAQEFVDNVKILRTLTSDGENWAGCMAELNKVLLDEGFPECGINIRWVTFDCTGELGTPVPEANRMWESVLFAKALDRNARVYIDTTQKAEGRFCRAYRIDVY